MRGARQAEATQGFTKNACCRPACRVRGPVVSHRVGIHHHCRVGLVDRIGDRRTADVVVVAGAREAPGITGIRTGARVRRVAHVNSSDCRPRLAVHTGNRRD